MRHTIFLMFMAICINATSQTTKQPIVKKENQSTQIDSLLTINNELLDQIEIDLSVKGRYKLYQTDNIYTLLKLDTRTGRIDQLQWSLDSSNEGSVTINDVDFTYGKGYGSFRHIRIVSDKEYVSIYIDR